MQFSWWLQWKKKREIQTRRERKHYWNFNEWTCKRMCGKLDKLLCVTTFPASKNWRVINSPCLRSVQQAIKYTKKNVCCGLCTRYKHVCLFAFTQQVKKHMMVVLVKWNKHDNMISFKTFFGYFYQDFL